MATVNLSDYKPLQINNAGSFRIGIVVSEWNDFVTHNLRDAAVDILKTEGVLDENIKIFKVPGAFELTYASMQLCKERKFDAVIADELWDMTTNRLLPYSGAEREWNLSVRPNVHRKYIRPVILKMQCFRH